MLHVARARATLVMVREIALGGVFMLVGCNSSPSGPAVTAPAATNYDRLANPSTVTAPEPSSSNSLRVSRPPKPGLGEPIHVTDIVDYGAEFEGKTITLDIVEPLSGLTAHSNTTGPYPLRVDAPELIGSALNLVPPTFNPKDSARYMSRPHVNTPPMRATGRLGRDRELERGTSKTWVLYVVRTEPLTEGSAVAASMEEVLRDPPKWDRRLVVLEGNYRRSFEVSDFEGAWLAPSAATPEPMKLLKSGRIRITARVYARIGHRYGHLGMSQAQVEVSKFDQL
jgi:hypothetical protein